MTEKIIEALTLYLGLRPGALAWLRAKWRILTARLHSITSDERGKND